MRKYNPREPVIFVHLPKCAGTSFIRLLRNWFGEGYRHPHVNEQCEGTTLPKLDVLLEDGSFDPEIKCIHAHFDHGRGYGLPSQFPEVNQYFTIVRDPFDIVVSMYFFAKAKSARGEFFYDGRQIDIREQYSSVADYVAERPDWLYNHFPQDITLENHREKLAARFVHVGLFEELPRSIDHLAKVLKKKPVVLPHANKSTYDEPLPLELRQRFYHEHPLLKGIHDFARSSHERIERSTRFPNRVLSWFSKATG